MPLSHGPGGAGSHAGCASHLDQLKGSHERKDTAAAMEGHVRHCREVEKVTRAHTAGQVLLSDCVSAGAFSPALLAELSPVS